MMFTGLVESMGRVRERAGTHLAVDCGFARELVAGESVAVNGVCLTVEVANASGFTATTVPTTLRRTTLGTLTAGSAVNLERALGASARLGGHIVQGHVDGIGALVGRLPDGEWELLRFAAPVEVGMMFIAAARARRKSECGRSRIFWSFVYEWTVVMKPRTILKLS